jgi:hypothetical protein
MRCARLILLIGVLLSGCTSPDESQRPVKLVMKDGGPPASWTAGDRVKVEGRLTKYDKQPHVLGFTVGEGAQAWKHCAIVRGVEDLGFASRWKAWWFANGDALVAATGITLPERQPSFRLASGGQHTHRGCTFAIRVEKIEGL